jgi:hypothetical protein
MDMDLRLGPMDMDLRLGPMDMDLRLGPMDMDFRLGTMDMDLRMGPKDIDLMLGPMDMDLRLGPMDMDFRLGPMDMDLRLGPMDMDLRLGPMDMDLRLGPMDMDFRLGPMDMDLRLGPMDMDFRLGPMDMDLRLGPMDMDLRLGLDNNFQRYITFPSSSVKQYSATEKSLDWQAMRFFILSIEHSSCVSSFILVLSFPCNVFGEYPDFGIRIITFFGITIDLSLNFSDFPIFSDNSTKLEENKTVKQDYRAFSWLPPPLRCLAKSLNSAHVNRGSEIS